MFSALSSNSDIARRSRHVSKVPMAEISEYFAGQLSVGHSGIALALGRSIANLSLATTKSSIAF
jgi:hypothetical protein